MEVKVGADSRFRIETKVVGIFLQDSHIMRWFRLRPEVCAMMLKNSWNFSGYKATVSLASLFSEA